MSRVTGKNGAVALFAGVNADFAAWRLAVSHPVDDDTAYSDTGSGSSHSGSGCVDYNLGASGFLKSNANPSAPGFGTISPATSATIASPTGGQVTLTAHTGCTEVGTFILSGGSIDHRKRAGAIPVSYDGINDGDLAETWAVS